MEKTVVVKLPAGVITEIKNLDDGTFEVVMIMSEEEADIPNEFILVDAENLSHEDEFMKWEPRTATGVKTKALISEAIGKRVMNFYRPKCDPSFDKQGKICYQAGFKPAVCKSYNWWEKNAKEFCPERNSRFGTRLEYGAFLGVLIKKLFEKSKSLEWAWISVCSHSEKLGHYSNSDDAKSGFELTGSRGVCGFYDLANTYKFLADANSRGFWQASGAFNNNGSLVPIADISYYTSRNANDYYSVGWIIFEK